MVPPISLATVCELERAGHFDTRSVEGFGPEIRKSEEKNMAEKTYLIQPSSCEPYVKRQKNNAADAEAIWEAVTRANMRFVEQCLKTQRCTHPTSHPSLPPEV